MIEKIIKGIKYRLDEKTMSAEVIAKRNGYESPKTRYSRN